MGRGTRPTLVQGQSDHKMVPDSPEKKVSQKMVAPLLGLGTQNAGGQIPASLLFGFTL